MINFFKLSIFASLLVIGGFALAQPKIAVVDFDEAILGSDYAKQRFEELQQSNNYKQLNTELNSLKADSEAMSKEFENSENWSTEKRQEFQEKAQYVRADYELAAKKINAKQQQVLKEIAYSMQEKTKAELKELIDAEKVELLLDRKAVLFSGPEYDITNKLIAKLNKK